MVNLASLEKNLNENKVLPSRFKQCLPKYTGVFTYLLSGGHKTPNNPQLTIHNTVKGKGSPYSITERRVPELIPVLGSQPAGDVSHKPGSR